MSILSYLSLVSTFYRVWIRNIFKHVLRSTALDSEVTSLYNYSASSIVQLVNLLNKPKLNIVQQWDNNVIKPL